MVLGLGSWVLGLGSWVLGCVAADVQMGSMSPIIPIRPTGAMGAMGLMSLWHRTVAGSIRNPGSGVHRKWAACETRAKSTRRLLLAAGRHSATTRPKRLWPISKPTSPQASLVGAGYATAAFFHFGLPAATCGLAGGGLCAVAGILPDLDSDESIPLREITSLAAAWCPSCWCIAWGSSICRAKA